MSLRQRVEEETSCTSGTNESRLMSFTASPSFDRVTDLNTCAGTNRALQVESRSCPERLPAATATSLEAAPREGGGDRSVILSLQNISTETQAQSRLAVLCRVFCSDGSLVTHWAYGPSLPIFGGTTGKPGGRMPAARLFDNKQEGSP
jgi:hypothetical protein